MSKYPDQEEPFQEETYPSNYPIKEKKTRATKIIKKRRFKQNKKNPKRIKSITVEDKGKILETTSITYPFGVQIKRTKHSKKKNANLLVFNICNLKLSWRIDLKKGAFFDYNGIYLGEIAKHDLKRLFTISSRLLKLEKRNTSQKSRTIFKTVTENKANTKRTP
jgi:hypothetical protein